IPRRLGPGTGARTAHRAGRLQGSGPMTPDGSAEKHITLREASRIAGVSSSTLKRWASEGVLSLENGHWTPASAAQARVIARMRARGYSMEEVKEAARGGRLAFGYTEDLLQVPEGHYTREEAAERTGLEPELVERLMTLLGTPMGADGRLNEEDLRAMRHCA